MNPLFNIPEDLAQLSADELNEFIAATRDKIEEVTSTPSEFISDDMTSAQLLGEVRSAAEVLQAARVELTSRETAPEADAVEEAAVEGETENADEFAAEMAELAAAARETDDEPETASVEVEVVAADEVVVTASAKPKAEKPIARRLPDPARNRRPAESLQQEIALVASGSGVPGMEAGEAFPTANEIAKAMLDRKRTWGMIPAGTEGEKVPIARADWSELYPEDRKLTGDIVTDMALVASATDENVIRAEMLKRKKGALTASGGLCAPVTPYYGLQVISTASRPVRAALPAFNATRGGIRFARPAALTVIDSAIGRQTMADDASGGSAAVKGCQRVDCPPWQEVDIATIYHCLSMGNIMQRTFPELLAQWTELAMAAQARFAEGHLLTGIKAASTDVTAASLGYGAIGDLLPQVLTAAEGMRSRHRMGEATLRLLMPDWAIALLVSDSIRSEFERFDTDEQRVTAKLREFGVEPSFYLDSATGSGQIFGAQADGALLPFPDTINWFLYPEGSFLFIDGGSLELGLVRDSILNSTNDFQIFGETFENVAFTGIESLSVTSTVCDSGVVAAPAAPSACGDYS